MYVSGKVSGGLLHHIVAQPAAAIIMRDDDYWFEQRYDDLMYDEHTKGHPNSDEKCCQWCQEAWHAKNAQS